MYAGVSRPDMGVMFQFTLEKDARTSCNIPVVSFSHLVSLYVVGGLPAVSLRTVVTLDC